MNTTAQSRSYDGETVYTGIDVHKRSYTVVVRAKQLEVKPWTAVACIFRVKGNPSHPGWQDTAL
jgi:hypothetical protein